MNSLPYIGTRPYRVELIGTKAAGTFASEEGARRWIASPFNVKRGARYRIVKRLNKSGSKREIIAEEVKP